MTAEAVSERSHNETWAGGIVSRTLEQMVPVMLGEGDWLAPGDFLTIFFKLG